MAYAKHMVIEEDTVQQLAQRYLDDATRWVEIVVANELEYPYIINRIRQDGDSKRVRCIGEYLIIPVELDYDTSKMTTSQLQENYDYIFGADISCFSKNQTVDMFYGEVAEMSGDGKGDIKLAKGFDNLRQAILLRLATPRGSLLHHPEYGTWIYDHLGVKDTHENREKIKVEIQRVIMEDRRVEEVTIEKFYIENSVCYVYVKIQPIDVREVINLGITMDTTGIIQWSETDIS